MRVFEGKRQGVQVFGHDNHVNVVRQKSVADDGEPVSVAVGAEEVEVDQAVGIGLKGLLLGIAALGDVMRRVDGDDAGETSHSHS